LEGYLETLGARLRNSQGQRFDELDRDAWRAFAEMLMAARIYE
jgi:hypothetical protein